MGELTLARELRPLAGSMRTHGRACRYSRHPALRPTRRVYEDLLLDLPRVGCSRRCDPSQGR